MKSAAAKANRAPAPAPAPAPTAKPVVVGEGTHAYRFITDHFQIPNTIALGDCHGVVVDRRDHVFILQQNGNTDQPQLLEFDPQGRFVRGSAQRFARGAHGLCLDAHGKTETLWLTDYELGEVVQLSLDGRELRSLPKPVHAAYPGGQGYKPTDVSVASDGSVFVTDGYGRSLIHRYDASGTHVQTIGWKGNGPGQFECPHGICVDERGSEPVLLVADRANVRVQVLSLRGEHRQTIISRGLRYPCTLRVAGELTLVPDLFGAVLLWDKNYNHLATLAAHPDMRPGEWPKHVAGYPCVPREDRLPGRFISPHGIGADSKGNIYVAEWLRDGGRLTKLSPA